MALALPNLTRNAKSSVSMEEFQGLLEKMFSKVPSRSAHLRNAKRIAVAFSGGPDSLALLSLARKIYPRERLLGIFVHHGLQSMGVTEDEERVMQLFETLDIEGKMIRAEWDAGELAGLSKGAMQERARQKRYKALLDVCVERETPLVLSAHTLDDDLVTMLYRFSHGSGLDGIAGMKQISPFPLVDVMSEEYFVGRPLLTIPKERLLRTCEEHKLQWVIDGSNRDLHYHRNSITAALCEIMTPSSSNDKKVQDNSLLKGTELVEMLNICKLVAGDIQNHLSQLFSKSIFIDRRIGDATLILSSPPASTSSSSSSNTPSMPKNPPMIISRAIGLMGQYAAARNVPVKTRRMQEIQTTLQAAWSTHQKEQMCREQAMRARLRGILSPTQMMPYERARRVQVSQMTFGGATIFSLGRDDALRRTSRFSKWLGRKIEPGPAFLIQREPPSRIDNQKAKFLPVTVELAPGQWYCWDDRLYLQFQAPEDSSITFTISYLTMADVREFERLTTKTPLLRRSLYSYLGVTPASHLYQVPVVRIEGYPAYMAFPSLQTQYPMDYLTWNTRHAGNSLLVAKLECLQ